MRSRAITSSLRTVLLGLSIVAPAAAGGDATTPSGQEAGTREPPGIHGPAVDGRAVYNRHCYFCHGFSGDAQTLARRFLQPPPRNFKSMALFDRSRADMLRSVRDGRPGTAMKAFESRLTPAETEAVVDFIRDHFIATRASNSRYHTPENGWSEPRVESPATPFVTGAVPLDTPWPSLSPARRRGKQLYLETCVTCHDRAVTKAPGPAWEAFAVSYPVGNYLEDLEPDEPDETTPFAAHEDSPTLGAMTATERRGETLYRTNCASCHAEDGTGRNWRGSFLARSPTDLTHLEDASIARLTGVIRDGLPGTSMPSWRRVLGERDIQAIAAYVIRAFHGPRRATLSQIEDG